MEQALYGIVFLSPSGPGRVVVKGSVPLLRESEPVEGGEEGKQEISLGSGEGVVSWGEGKDRVVVRLRRGRPWFLA